MFFKEKKKFYFLKEKIKRLFEKRFWIKGSYKENKMFF